MKLTLTALNHNFIASSANHSRAYFFPIFPPLSETDSFLKLHCGLRAVVSTVVPFKKGRTRLTRAGCCSCFPSVFFEGFVSCFCAFYFLFVCSFVFKHWSQEFRLLGSFPSDHDAAAGAGEWGRATQRRAGLYRPAVRRLRSRPAPLTCAAQPPTCPQQARGQPPVRSLLGSAIGSRRFGPPRPLPERCRVAMARSARPEEVARPAGAWAAGSPWAELGRTRSLPWPQRPARGRRPPTPRRPPLRRRAPTPRFRRRAAAAGAGWSRRRGRWRGTAEASLAPGAGRSSSSTWAAPGEVGGGQARGALRPEGAAGPVGWEPRELGGVQRLCTRYRARPAGLLGRGFGGGTGREDWRVIAAIGRNGELRYKT